MSYKRTALKIAIFVLFYLIVLPLLPSLYNTITSLASPVSTITITYWEARYNASTNEVVWIPIPVSYNLAYIFGVLLIIIILLAPIIALMWG